MGVPLSQAARDRLRAQMRREKDLAARVLAAEARLADAVAKREAAVAAQDAVVAERRSAVADALASYVDDAGVDRAAVILGRSKAEIARTVRDRRASTLPESPRTT